MTGQWDRLAKEVKRRREQLRLRQRDVELRGGPGPGTMRNIEQATREGYALRTFDSLERALEWRPGIISKILEGTVAEEELRARPAQTIHPESIPSRASVGKPTVTVDEPRIHEKSGGTAGVVRGSGRVDLGFSAGGTGQAHTPDVRTEDGGGGTDSVTGERPPELQFGPGERIPPRDATIVRVAELLARLRAEQERTPTMDAAEAALLRLLPELYGREHPAIGPAERLKFKKADFPSEVDEQQDDLRTPDGKYAWRTEGAPSSHRPRPDHSERSTGSE